MRTILRTLFARRRTPCDQEVREPTLLTLVLTVVGFLLLLAICAVGIASMSAFGYSGWTFTAVALVLALVVSRLRRKPGASTISLTRRRLWFRRIRNAGWLAVIGILTCWLGLNAWSELRPGGSAPPPKSNPDLIRVVTWNIHCGQDEGLPWKQFDWPRRKHALDAALDQAKPDILCVQEATPPQVAFLESVLPSHGRVGVGRDGEAGGEHCAIYFNRQRFEEIGGGTFWLEEPIDQPRPGSALDVKRICTWVRLRDQVTGRTVRVYNTHLYLTEAPRRTAAKIILDHVTSGDRDDAILLSADFNASPSAPSRRPFIEAGLRDSAALAGKPASRPTFHLYGIGLWCIDGILVDSHWRVNNHHILHVKPRNAYPSDHFAVMADLDLRAP